MQAFISPTIIEELEAAIALSIEATATLKDVLKDLQALNVLSGSYEY